MATKQSNRSSTTEVTDERDISPRVVKQSLKGQRVRAIPALGGTTIEIRDTDFAKGGIDHPTVTWDFRIDDFTVPVGEVLSREAAEYLCNSFPDSFRLIVVGG